jgi:hypothetical protein
METKFTINITEINGLYATTVQTIVVDGINTIERKKLTPAQLDAVLTLINSFA